MNHCQQNNGVTVVEKGSAKLNHRRELQAMLQKSAFELHTRDVMRAEAHKAYGFNAQFQFRRTHDHFYEVAVSMEPCQGTIAWECPATFDYLLHCLMQRIAYLQGYSHIAFGQLCASEGATDGATNGQRQYGCRMQMDGVRREDGDTPVLGEWKIAPVLPDFNDLGIAKDLMRWEYY